MRFLILAGIVWLMANSVAMSGEIVKLEKNYFYNITGSSAKELRTQMRTLTSSEPPCETEAKYWGYTCRTISKENNCTRIVITNHYTLPRWVNPEAGSLILRLRWKRMLASLKSHERGHGRINIRAAKEHLRAGCKNKEEIKARRKTRNKRYDKLTKHGTLTGVFLF